MPPVSSTARPPTSPITLKKSRAPLSPAAPAAPVVGGADRLERGARVTPWSAPAQAPEPAGTSARRSPLATRIDVLRGAWALESSDVLARTLSELLGVDVGQALTELQGAVRLDGQLRLTLELKQGTRHRLPQPGKADVAVVVPAQPEGVQAQIQVVLGVTEQGEPALSSVDIRFVNGKDGDALRQSALPRIANPSALESSGQPLVDFAIDAAADIAFRGLHIDASGAITLDADVAVFQGLKTEDFQARAKDKLPTLRMKLSEFGVEPSDAAGNPAAFPAPPGSAISLDTLLEGLGASLKGGRWEADLSVAGPVPGEVRARGEVVQAATGGLALRADLELGLAGQRRTLALEANHAARGAQGNAKLWVRNAKEREAPLAVSWGRDGVHMESAESLLPLRLETWRGPGPAPTLGTPAFKARLARLLDAAAPVRTGNQVTFLRDGTDVLQERLKLLRSAQAGDTVVLQTFILHDDTTGGLIIDELIAAKARGADVKVMLDAAGCAVEPTDAIDGGDVLRRLREGQVEAHLFNSAPPLINMLQTKLADTLEDPPLDEAAREAFPSVARLLDRLEELHKNPVLDGRIEPTGAIRFAPTLIAAAQELQNLPREGAPARVLRLARAFWPTLEQVGRWEASALLREMLPQLGRDHRKLLAVYGRDEAGQPKAQMLVGGNNIDDTYHLEPGAPLFSSERHGALNLWNDADLRIVGPEAVQDAVRGFALDFPGDPPAEVPRRVSAPPDHEGAALRVVQHVPLATSTGAGDNHFTNALLAVLEGADWGTEIAIENPFFVPIPELRDAMVAAARRGAQIQIVTNGLADNHENQMVSRHVRQFILPELLQEKNIKFYETNTGQQPIHRKTLVARTRADEHLYVLGSQNLDRLSAAVNRELFVIGGAAASDLGDRWHNEQVARELWRDLQRDTEPGYATRVDPASLTLPVEEALVGYARSLGRLVF